MIILISAAKLHIYFNSPKKSIANHVLLDEKLAKSSGDFAEKEEKWQRKSDFSKVFVANIKNFAYFCRRIASELSVTQLVRRGLAGQGKDAYSYLT